MTIIHHDKLDQYFKKKQVDETSFLSIYLIYGDELLCRQAEKSICAALGITPGKSAAFSQMDGAIEHIPELFERLNTYSLFSELKIVAVRDAVFFQIEKPKEIAIVERLAEAVEKGFPKAHYLLISTDRVDKRKKLYKIINKNGLVVDCAVPAGARAAEKREQVQIARRLAEKILATKGKRMSDAALNALLERTGVNLREFSGNIEKLVDFVGDRKVITPDDVTAVSVKTREDPIYALTNAVSDRDAGRAVYLIDNLLTSGYYPLQILSALTNQIRRLLIVKDFLDNNKGRAVWQKGASYAYFQQQVLPLAVEEDESLVKSLSDWDDGAKLAGDLMIAKNPRNAYPIYQQFLKSDRFTLSELMDGFELLMAADIRLKTSGTAPQRVLEKLVFDFCIRQ